MKTEDTKIVSASALGTGSWLAADHVAPNPAHRFALGVCEMFRDDGTWSVMDIDGAKEFFAAVGFTPPPWALVEDEPEEITCQSCGDSTDSDDSPDGKSCPDCYDREQYVDEDDEETCDDCGEPLDEAGDGYDGKCADCADRAELDRLEDDKGDDD